MIILQHLVVFYLLYITLCFDMSLLRWPPLWNNECLGSESRATGQLDRNYISDFARLGDVSLSAEVLLQLWWCCWSTKQSWSLWNVPRHVAMLGLDNMDIQLLCYVSMRKNSWEGGFFQLVTPKNFRSFEVCSRSWTVILWHFTSSTASYVRSQFVTSCAFISSKLFNSCSLQLAICRYCLHGALLPTLGWLWWSSGPAGLDITQGWAESSSYSSSSSRFHFLRRCKFLQPP